MTEQRKFIVVDSLDYAKKNCFVSQLIDALILESNKQVEIINLEGLRYLVRDKKRINEQNLLFLVRQRIFHRHLDEISYLVGDAAVDVYDQDPWNSYIIGSPSFGFYEKMKKQIPVATLFLTSKWWSDFVLEREKINSVFVKMWMAQNLCTDSGKRTIPLGFRGTLRGHRKDFFSDLEKMGIKVKIDGPGLKYKKYLKYLSSLQIFIHDESDYFICDFGKTPMSNAMWVKDIEIAARGTFVIRNENPQSNTYDIDKIPLIKTYKSIEEIPETLTLINRMSDLESQIVRRVSVDYIIQKNYWKITARQMLSENKI